MGLEEVGQDFQYLGSVIVKMGLVIRRLERRINMLEDDCHKADCEAIARAPAPTYGAITWAPAPPHGTIARAPAPTPSVPRAPCLDKGKQVTTLPPRPNGITPAVAIHPSAIPPPGVKTASWSQVASQGAEGGNLPW